MASENEKSSNSSSQNGEGSTPRRPHAATGSAALTDQSLSSNNIDAVAAKLEEVRKYIQTTNANMRTLEEHGDTSKIGQYNILVKVLRELKLSEAKLNIHLTTLQHKAEGIDTSSATVDMPNSQVVGVVPPSAVNAVDNVGGRPSMSDRLTASMAEAEQLTGRLRDNIHRREDLVERYRLTRERLAALKRQRRDIIGEERTILQQTTGQENPYQDPLPGVHLWNLDEINKGLGDFRALFEKVAALYDAYETKLAAIPEGVQEGRAEVEAKVQQLDEKKAQLIGVIGQLKGFRINKMRELGMDVDTAEDGLAPVPVFSSSTTTSTSTVSTTSVSSFVASVSSLAASVSSPASVSPSASVLSSAEIPHLTTLHFPSRPSQKSGGSMPMGRVPPIVNDATEVVELDPAGAVIAARAEVAAAGQELSLRTRQLSNLREELDGMKQLLNVTRNNMNQSQNRASSVSSDSTSNTNETEVEILSSSRGEVEILSSSRQDEEEPELSSRIPLSVLESQNPVVLAKYKELAAAKSRMAEMETIMAAISASRGSGRPLDQVLTQRQRTVLKLAQDGDIEGLVSGSSIDEPASASATARSSSHLPFTAAQDSLSDLLPSSFSVRGSSTSSSVRDRTRPAQRVFSPEAERFPTAATRDEPTPGRTLIESLGDSLGPEISLASLTQMLSDPPQRTTGARPKTRNSEADTPQESYENSDRLTLALKQLDSVQSSIKDIFEEVKSSRTKHSSAQVDQQNIPSFQNRVPNMFNQQPTASAMPQSFNNNTSFSQLPNAMRMNSTAKALPTSMNSNNAGMNNQMKEQTEMCTMFPNTQGSFMFNGMNAPNSMPYMNNMNPMCMGMMPAYMPQLMMPNFGGMMPNFMPNAYGGMSNSMMGFPSGMVSNMNGTMANGNCFMTNSPGMMVGMNQNGYGMNQNGYGMNQNGYGMNQNGYGMITPNMGGGNMQHGGNNLPMLPPNDETRFQSNDHETKKTRESGNEFFQN